MRTSAALSFAARGSPSLASRSWRRTDPHLRMGVYRLQLQSSSIVVAPVAYHARSSGRGRRLNRRLQLSPEERVDAAVTIKVLRACPSDIRVGLIGEGGMLGKWDTSKVNPMRRAQRDPNSWEWVLAVGIGANLAFKLVTIDQGDAVVQWSQGADIRVSVPYGCTGVEIIIDWPSGSPRDAPLSVNTRVIVEKPLHDYRVETGGAWLAYGKIDGSLMEEGERGVNGDDTVESKEHVHQVLSSVDNRALPDTKERQTETNKKSLTEQTTSHRRFAVDAIDAVVMTSGGTAKRATSGQSERTNASLDAIPERPVVLSSNNLDPDAKTDMDTTINNAHQKEESNSTSEKINEEKLAGGYIVGSHLESMMGGMRTELIFNAAQSEERGVRVGIVEEGRLVEMWHEHAAGPGEGMRVGDVYLGVVAKVISGMQGVLVDVTGKGPPYTLMQKGVDEPALAWCLAEGPREEDDWGDDECGRDSKDENTVSDAVDRKWARLERGGSLAVKAGGRWAKAWAEGVGTSDDFNAGTCSGNVTDAGTSADVEYDSSEEEARDLLSAKAEPPNCRAINAENPKILLDSKSARDLPRRQSKRVNGAADARLHWVPWKDHIERIDRDGAFRLRGVVKHWKPGMPVVVQVTRLGSGHKGPRVTARPTLPGRNVVLCPDGQGVYVSRKLVGKARAYVKAVGATVVPDDCALIMRTEAAGVSKEVLAMDIRSLANDWTTVHERASAAVLASGEHGRSPMPRRLLDAATVEQILVRDLFGERIARLSVDTVEAYDAIIDDLRRTGATEDTISKVELHTGQEDVFDALGQRKAVSSAEEERVWLTSPDLPGAHLVIQQTEALTAVDVNAGRAAFVSNSDTESVAQAVNVAAAKEIALQLRLRDIGGLVMIDFIDMTSREHRKTVEAAFLNAAKDDRAQLTFLPISPLGVMEIARERLQGNHSGQRVIADEKGMPIVPVGPNGGPRRMKGPRPPPWVTRGRGSRRDRSSDATAAHGNDFGNVLLNDKVSVGRGRFRGIRNRSPGRVERDDAGASGIHSGSSFYGRERRGRSSRGRGKS